MQRYFKWRCIFLCLPSNVSDCVCNAMLNVHNGTDRYEHFKF